MAGYNLILKYCAFMVPSGSFSCKQDVLHSTEPYATVEVMTRSLFTPAFAIVL
jgi:hypothetical protein